MSLRIRPLASPRPLPWIAGLLTLLSLMACQSPQPTASKPLPATRAPAASSPRRSLPASAWEREANRWLGTPYVVGGMSRKGVDCSGFVAQMYRTVAGMELPRTSRDQYRVGRPVSRDALLPGDLLFFNTNGQGVSHAGIAFGGDRFVHATTSRGVIVSSLKERYYASRLLGARRVLH